MRKGGVVDGVLNVAQPLTADGQLCNILFSVAWLLHIQQCTMHDAALTLALLGLALLA